MKKKTVTKKDTFLARVAFYLSLGFWVPLFNVGLSIVAIVIAFKALKRLEDERFGGLAYIIIALVLGFATAVGSVVFLVVYLSEKLTCANLPNIF